MKRKNMNSLFDDLLKEIRNEQLEKLALSGSSFGNERVCELVNELKGNKSVKQVFFSGCERGFVDVLCDVLKVNTSVTKLNLGYNNLGDEGARVISEACKVNQCVKDLNLAVNNIGSEGARAIGGMLNLNKTLKELVLSGNNLGPEGGRLIAEALKVNKSVEVLWLSDNGLGKEGARAIGEALKVNWSLKELYFYGNDIRAEGAHALQDALQVNGHLMYCVVDTSWNEVNVLCERNKAMHKRARESVVHLLALRTIRRMIWIPKEIIVIIGQMVWRTKCDIDVWMNNTDE